MEVLQDLLFTISLYFSQDLTWRDASCMFLLILDIPGRAHIQIMYICYDHIKEDKGPSSARAGFGIALTFHL